MRQVLSIFVIGFFLVNCTSNTIIEKPDDLIPKEQMVDLLSDLFLASGAQHIKNKQLQRNVNYFPLVFEKHQIDSARFARSNHYYTSRIDDIDEILNEVSQRLSVQRDEIEAAIKVQDSLKKTKKKLKLNDSIVNPIFLENKDSILRPLQVKKDRIDKFSQ